MLILAGDSLEARVTKEAPGDHVHKSNTLLMKSTMGYPSGVVGVSEVTTSISLAANDTALLITNYVDGDDDLETDHNSNPIPNVV